MGFVLLFMCFGLGICLVCGVIGVIIIRERRRLGMVGLGNWCWVLIGIVIMGIINIKVYGVLFYGRW